MKKLLFSSFLSVVFLASCTHSNSDSPLNTDTIKQGVLQENIDSPSTTTSVPIQGNPITPVEGGIVNDPITEKGNPPHQDSNRNNKVIKHGSPNQSYVDSVKAAKKKQKENSKN